MLTALIFLGHNVNHTHAEEIPIRERLISIDVQDQDFLQTLEVLAGQLGITIEIHGSKPGGTRSIDLDYMPVDKAMVRIMRAYGVRNHVASFNPEEMNLTLIIIGSAPFLASESVKTPKSRDFWKDEPLTKEQLARLREQSAIIVAQMEEAAEPLTPEQLERLREQSAKIEAEIEESSQPLTEEQLERLREQSFWIELDMQEASQPLTSDQLERLREQSRRIQEEEERAAQPLTEEQLRRIREQSKELE